MLFNGNFIFFSISISFLCYSMESLYLFNYPWYSMGSLHFVIFLFYSMGIWKFRSLGGGRTYGRTDVRRSGNSPLCPTGHRPFEAAAQKGFDKVIVKENNYTTMKRIEKEEKIQTCDHLIDRRAWIDSNIVRAADDRGQPMLQPVLLCDEQIKDRVYLE